MVNVFIGRHCEVCLQDFSSGGRCRGCNLVVCDTCTKGGRSSAGGKLLRGVFGLATYGVSEVVRAAMRSSNQACPRCGTQQFISI
jgi:hypothetical protein